MDDKEIKEVKFSVIHYGDPKKVPTDDINETTLYIHEKYHRIQVRKAADKAKIVMPPEDIFSQADIDALYNNGELNLPKHLTGEKYAKLVDYAVLYNKMGATLRRQLSWIKVDHLYASRWIEILIKYFITVAPGSSQLDRESWAFTRSESLKAAEEEVSLKSIRLVLESRLENAEKTLAVLESELRKRLPES